MSEKITKTDEEWKKELSSDEYEVCRQKGTERAFTGMYWDCKDKGVYKCRGCGIELCSSTSVLFIAATHGCSAKQPQQKTLEH